MTYLDDLLSDEKYAAIFAQEVFSLQVSETLLAYMENEEVTFELLAERLGVNKDSVSRMFADETKLTLGQVASIAHVLGASLELSLRTKE